MKRNDYPAEESEDLRPEAERRLRAETISIHEMSEDEVATVVHELRVHQVELQMQNEELRKAQIEIDQSRGKYAELFDFAPVGYLVFDDNGLVVEANLTAASMLGWNRDEVIGRPFSVHVAPAGQDTWRLHLGTLFKTGKEQQCEIEVIGKSRVHKVVRLQSRPVRETEGKVILCRTAMSDVTALVRTEQRLRDSERRFRTLAENSPDVVVRVDRDMRVVYVNKSVEKALGIPPEELIGRTLDELDVPADLVETWTAAAEQVFKTAKPGRVEFTCSAPQGLRYHSSVVVPEFEEDRTVRTVLATIRDITDRVQAEEKYTAIIHSLEDGFCILDAEGRYLEINDGFCLMLGRSREEVLQLTIFDVWEAEQREQLTAHLQNALKDGSEKFTVRHQREDGSPLVCDMAIQRLYGDRLFVFGRDVTKQQMAEEERLEALQQFEMIARATNDGIWDWDIPADRCWHNEAYAEMFGYAPEEVRTDADWWRQRIHPDDRENVLSTLDETAQGQVDTWSAKYRFQRKDGSYAWVIDRAYLGRDNRGKVVRMVGSSLDLTEKIEVLDQLEKERSKLATILDTAPTGIVVADRQGRITYANATAERLYGQPAPVGTDIESRRKLGFHYPDGRPYEPRDLPLVRAALNGETLREVEMLLHRPDGRQLRMLSNTAPLLDAQGEVTGAVAIFQDVTEIKEAELALRQAHDGMEQCVRERTRELDETVATLQEEVAERIEAQNQLIRQNDVLQKIINNIPVMLCFFDSEGHVGMINEEVTEVLGWSLQDFQEHDVMELCYPDPEYRQEVWEYMKAAEPGWRDFLVQRKDGGKVISSWANVRLADNSYVGIGIDIRERKRFENRLRENEERYRTLVEMAPDAICVERDGIIRFANSTAVRLLGAKTADEIIGRSILDFIHPDYKERVEQQFARLRTRREPTPVTEEKIARADGAVLDVELAAMPIVFENKPANQIVLHDITQRKQVETRLRENARQLEQQAELLDLAHDSIVVNDMEGRIVFWNRGAEQTYGWSRQEAVGMIGHEMLKTQFPSNLIEITAKLLSQGRWNGELTHTTRQGETIVVSSRWALQRDEDGRPTGILVIDRDITQQKRAEQATIEALRFADSITHTIQESLLVLDHDLKVISANQTFHRTFQVSPEETAGRLIYDLGNRQWDIPELRRLLEDILPHDTSLENYEVESDFEHIGRRTMLLNARRIYRQDQGTEMILLAIQDITVRKEQEQKIREHQRELSNLTEELLLTEERERRRLALLLHDSIGQSLAFSKREIGVLQKNTSGDLKDALEYVKQQIDESIHQTRNLTFELSPTTLHTFGLEAAVEELVEQIAQQAGFQYRFEATDDDKPLSEQIKALLYRASRELLTNIAKHAEAANVFIRIDRPDESIRIVVEDDGKGFDVSRLEEVVRQQKGLGLFNIRERLTHVGGSFNIESQPGKGTKVTLVAPLHRG